MKSYEIYLVLNTGEKILIGKKNNNEILGFIYNEELLIELNDKYTFTFNFSDIYKQDNELSGDFEILNLEKYIKIGTIIWLNTIKLIVTSISPVFYTNNTEYSVTCSDYFSYRMSKYGVGLTFDTITDEDFLLEYMEPSIWSISNYIFKKTGLITKKIFEFAEYIYKENVPWSELENKEFRYYPYYNNGIKIFNGATELISLNNRDKKSGYFTISTSDFYVKLNNNVLTIIRETGDVEPNLTFKIIDVIFTPGAWYVYYDDQVFDIMTKKINLEVNNSNVYNALIELSNICEGYLKIVYGSSAGNSIIHEYPKYIYFIDKKDSEFNKNYVLSTSLNIQELTLNYGSEDLSPWINVLGGKDEYEIFTSIIPEIPFAAEKYLKTIEFPFNFVENFYTDLLGEYQQHTIWQNNFFDPDDIDEYNENLYFAQIADNIPYLDNFIFNIEYFKENEIVSVNNLNNIKTIIYNQLPKINIELQNLSKNKNLLFANILETESNIKLYSINATAGSDINILRENEEKLKNLFYYEIEDLINKKVFETPEFESEEEGEVTNIIYSNPTEYKEIYAPSFITSNSGYYNYFWTEEIFQEIEYYSEWDYNISELKWENTLRLRSRLVTFNNEDINQPFLKSSLNIRIPLLWRNYATTDINFIATNISLEGKFIENSNAKLGFDIEIFIRGNSIWERPTYLWIDLFNNGEEKISTSWTEVGPNNWKTTIQYFNYNDIEDWNNAIKNSWNNIVPPTKYQYGEWTSFDDVTESYDVLTTTISYNLRKKETDYFYFYLLKKYYGFYIIKNKIEDLAIEMINFIDLIKKNNSKIINYQVELTNAETEKEKLLINEKISKLELENNSYSTAVGNWDFDLAEDIFEDFLPNPLKFIQNDRIGYLGYIWNQYLNYYPDYYNYIIETEQNNDLGLVDIFKDELSEKEKLLYEIKSNNLYGHIFLESYYENEIETDPIKLYNEAVLYSFKLNYPNEEFNITYLDASNLIGIPIQSINVGDYIHIENISVFGRTLKSEVVVNSIQKNLRSNSNIQITVDKFKFYDALIEKLMLNINK